MLEILSIILLVGVTWIWSLRGNWCSDDHEGIERFSDKFLPEGRDKDGKVVREEQLINSYEVETQKKEKLQLKNTDFNPYIPFPGSVIRWLRINLGKKWKEIAKDKVGHSIMGYVQEPWRHHLISLVLHTFNCVFVYLVLSKLFGTKLAFSATALFIVTPVACQTVAWCSGIGYLICMTAATASFCASLYIVSPLKYLLIPALSFLSISGLFSGTFNFAIFLFMGDWLSALIVLAISAFYSTNIGKQIFGLRASEFKKQNMGRSTYINWRKPIVMIKTFWYYLKMSLFPIKLGLFHVWGYNYDDTIEKTDSKFWLGLISFIGALTALIHPMVPLPVKFGILWWIIYLLTFSNFVTAMQFVADRYLFISQLGMSIVMAYFLMDYPELLMLIIGILMARTWHYIKAFDGDVKFYRSNIENFENSEVAYGNLGVTYVHAGMSGTAVDLWKEAIRINPFYDVPHYNLYSVYAGQGNLEAALHHMNACLNAKVVHFKDQWTKERDILIKKLELKKQVDAINSQLNAELNNGQTENVSKYIEEIKKVQSSL